MTCINTQIIATRLRLAKNFDMLIDVGIDHDTAASIIHKHSNIAFSEIRVSDDAVVIHYKTCRTTLSVDYAIVA